MTKEDWEVPRRIVDSVYARARHGLVIGLDDDGAELELQLEELEDRETVIKEHLQPCRYHLESYYANDIQNKNIQRGGSR